MGGKHRYHYLLLRGFTESFNLQIASSGPSFVASSQVLYNRLINFDPVKNPGSVAGGVMDHFAGWQNLYVHPAQRGEV